jgi:hypothetical protein
MVCTAEEIRAACEAPLPVGVAMVLMNKTITGLRVDEGGVSVLERPDRPWRQLTAVTKVSRGAFIRSRIRLRFADGSKVTVRPYKPKLRCLLETGKSDSLNFLLDAAAMPAATTLLAREMLGTSARAKQAAVLLQQLQAVVQAN